MTALWWALPGCVLAGMAVGWWWMNRHPALDDTAADAAAADASEAQRMRELVAEHDHHTAAVDAVLDAPEPAWPREDEADHLDTGADLIGRFWDHARTEDQQWLDAQVAEITTALTVLSGASR